MGKLDNIIFGKKKFSDILSEIYDNQKKKEQQITGLISELKPLVSDIGDATLIVPLIKDYLELGVRNDEQLIKMATIIQRAVNNDTGDGLGISDAEKRRINGGIRKNYYRIKRRWAIKQELVFLTALLVKIQGEI